MRSSTPVMQAVGRSFNETCLGITRNKSAGTYMKSLLDLKSYDEIQTNFRRERLWDLFEGNRTQMNLAHECIDRHASRGVAINVKHEGGKLETLEYGELSKTTGQFANWLCTKGVARGDIVAIILEPGKAFYTGVFGTIKRGAIAVPLFTLFGPEGLALRIDDCKPKLLLVERNSSEIREQFPEVTVQEINDDFWEQLSRESDIYQTDTKADDLCVLQYTSGTTRALPEAVPHTQRSVVTLMIAALYGTGLRPEDRFFCPSSPAWGHGLWHGTIAALALGIEIGTYSGKFEVVRIFEALDELKVDNFAAAATVFRLLRNSGLRNNYDINLKKCTFTGEPMDSSTFDWVRDAFGVSPGSMYGTTEVGVIIVDYPGVKGYEIRKGALGKPAPGNEVTVLANTGTTSRSDEIGELAVKRKGTWFRVKDFGRRDEDGYFYHAGRSDDVIISAGWTMSAVEIENTLLKHPAVGEAAVIGVPDEVRGQIARAFVVLRSDEEISVEALQDYMKERLSLHEYPREIEFLPDLPKTPAGKVNRKVLRDLVKHRN